MILLQCENDYIEVSQPIHKFSKLTKENFQGRNIIKSEKNMSSRWDLKS